MNEFETYYKNKFQKDILAFFSTVPEFSKHTFEDKSEFTIQYQTLTKDFKHLDFLTTKEKSYFGTALFFTVLVDQVCYSHFGQFYDKFKRLTLYPKFVGNSPSTDRTNFNPSDIFLAFNYSRDERKKIETETIIFWDVFEEAAPIMENETKGFFKQHLPDIDGQQFWDKCRKHFPYRLTEK